MSHFLTNVGHLSSVSNHSWIQNWSLNQPFLLKILIHTVNKFFLSTVDHRVIFEVAAMAHKGEGGSDEVSMIT